ncbi:DUF6879 family protein [Streptomyces sp. CA-243310]|uniref:DUF6879 family protein n=1 Tax=Streptomyces sp. CA-243310 TaxID=3240056 RepID=UPI003D8B6F60
MRQSVPTFPELFDTTVHTAVHLEMRDSYGVASESGDFATWRTTGERDMDPNSPYWRPWVDLVRRTVQRGVSVQRARIISMPASDYIRYEHEAAGINVAAGEEVRWLPRREASDIPLPGNDFWLFDDRLIRWNHFTGEGASGPGEVSEDPAAALLCAEAFREVWARAYPHESFKIY